MSGRSRTAPDSARPLAAAPATGVAAAAAPTPVDGAPAVESAAAAGEVHAAEQVSAAQATEGAAVLQQALSLRPGDVRRAPELLVQAAVSAELGGVLGPEQAQEAVAAVSELLGTDPQGQQLLARLVAAGLEGDEPGDDATEGGQTAC